jgi:hypothetical protein
MSVPEAKLGGIYKRMETDAEYRARLNAAGKYASQSLDGERLDMHGDMVRMQRRIVESEV